MRYRLVALGLTLLVGLAASTFGYYLAAPLPEASGPLVAGAPAGAASLLIARQLLAAPLPSGGQPAWVLVGNYLEQYLPIVVGLWALGFSVMVGRLLLALAYVQRLRRYHLGPVPAAWQQCFARLTRRADLGRPVRLFTSGLVASPLVIGHFKPLILLPLGLLSGLDPAGLEMLLAHELAHIIRRDYLVNFLQAVVETLFFYHPAVWFLSAVLHAERENCSDDLATQLGGNPRQLAHALAALAELTYFATPTPHLTLAALGPTSTLLHRVRRLAQPRQVKTAGLWPASGALLAVSLLLGGLLLTVRAAEPPHLRTTTTRTRRASTTKHRPDDAPRTGQAPLAQSDDALQALFQAQLQADGLLPNADRYALTLTATQLVINNQPQLITLLLRYQQLYEAATGYRMTATTTYHTENEVLQQVVRTPPTQPAPRPPTPQAVLRQLQHDKLVAATTRQFQVTATTAGSFLVNGRPQPAHLLAAYRPLLHLPPAAAGRTTTVAMTVR